jgi:hypothetical protein
MSNTSSENITEALEEALVEETNAETDTAPVETKTSDPSEAKTTSQDKGNTIPYSRFQEVVGQKNDLAAQIDMLDAAKTEALETVQNLSKQLDASRGELDLLNSIRALEHDPTMGPVVQQLDKYFRGELEEIEEDESLSDEDKNARARQVLENKQEQLEDQITDAQAHLVLQQADQIAERWLEALPEEYDDKDREVIANLWTNEVDWDVVADDPDNLDNVLHESLQHVLELYGTPRGGFIDPESVEIVDETESVEATPEQELEALLSSRNFGALTETKDGDKTILAPEVSDDDFTSAMAEALKIGNRARR